MCSKRFRPDEEHQFVLGILTSLKLIVLFEKQKSGTKEYGAVLCGCSIPYVHCEFKKYAVILLI